MAQKRNVFDVPTKAYLNSLMEIEFLVNVTEMQSKRVLTAARDRLSRSKKIRRKAGQTEQGIMGLAMCLSIPDLTSSTRTFFPYGRKVAMNEDMISLIEEIYQRFQAQVACMIYESLEVFLRHAAQLLFYAQRKDRKLQCVKRFHKAMPQWAKAGKRGTSQYYTAYVNHLTKKNCNSLIKELKSNIPSFASDKENANCRDIFSTYRILTCIRHTTVHNAGELSERAVKGLTDPEKELLEKMVRQSVLNGRKTILPTKHFVTILIEAMAGLGHSLYLHSSNGCNMKLRRFP